MLPCPTAGFKVLATLIPCAESWLALGSRFHDDQRLLAASVCFSRAVAIADEDVEVEALIRLGVASRDRGRFQLSRDTLNQAAALSKPGQSLRYYFAAASTRGMPPAPSSSREVGRVPSGALPRLPARWRRKLMRVHLARVAEPAECVDLIAAAEAHARASGGWDGRGHHQSFPTVDLVVADVPDALQWLNGRLRSTILPTLAEQFGVAVHELWLTDCFIIKYDACGGQAGLGAHVDQSEVSFNVLLNPRGAFEGGGTSFDALQATVQPDQGEMVSHCGALLHGGAAVASGTRYVLAGFVRVEPLAREWRAFRRHKRRIYSRGAERAKPSNQHASHDATCV